jgi:hypothetical protein
MTTLYHTPGKLYKIQADTGYGHYVIMYSDGETTSTFTKPDSEGGSGDYEFVKLVKTRVDAESVVMLIETIEFKKWDVCWWHRIMWNGLTGYIMAMPNVRTRYLENFELEHSSLGEIKGYCYE